MMVIAYSGPSEGKNILGLKSNTKLFEEKVLNIISRE